MSTFRSANSSRQSQSQIFSPIQKRQIYARPPPPNVRQPARKGTSVASSSVYDADETPPNVRLTLKQAITLITLRLGKLEVFANDMKITGGVPRNEEGTGIDKDFLLSIVSRLDNMEKMQHNLRIEIENIKNSLIAINQTLDEPEELIFDINEQPVIIDIINRLTVLDDIIKPKDIEPEETVEIPENEIVNNFPVYNPDVIEPYTEALVTEPVQTDVQTIETVQDLEPQPIQTPAQVQTPVQVQTPIQNEQNLKTPRKRGKKISIA